MIDQNPPDESTTQLSKNRTKKLAKKAAILANRPEKRRLEKEKKRQKKLDVAAKRANGELPLEASESKPKVKLMSESSNKFRVVIDMDFENLMTDEEIAKAAKQASRVYAINRKSDNPCQLYISSLKGKICARFAITCTGYTNWDVNMSEQDYLDIFVGEDILQNDKLSETKREELRNNIIYLTGDTEENLPDVEELIKDESKIFVIGGLVDHNRHKNLCYNRAQERHIRTAKLPIKEYVKLCDRHILSTVTVFDIMQRVLGSHKSWKEAFLESIPSRKIDHAATSVNQELVKPVNT